MVELPRVPRRLVTTEEARSSVSGGEIAAPYASLGRALSLVGDTVEGFGTDIAAEQGNKAVTRDADGNLQVQTMPFFSGKAGAAYNRVAKHSYLSQLDQEMKTKFQEKALELQDKPQEFAEWGQRYTDELAGRQRDDGLANAVKLAGGRMVGETSRSLTLRSHNVAQKRAQERMDNTLLTLSDELEQIALKDGVKTEGFASRMADINSILQEKVNNPAIAYPQEKADRAREEILTRAYGASILGSMERIYQEQGAEAAKTYLRDSTKQLGATIKDAAKIERLGLSWLRTENAQFAGERASVRQEWSEAKKVFETLSPERLDAMKEQAYAVGAHAVGRDIEAHQLAQDIVRETRGLPKEQQAEALRTGRLPSRAPAGTPTQVEALTGTANRLGINPRDLAAAISYETGGRFDPGMWGGKNNNHLGLIQFGAEERAKYGVKPGMTVEQQMGAVENYLRDRGVKPGMGISEIYRTINGGNPNAPLSASDGNATIGEHIERIKAGHYGNADKFLTGTGTAGAAPTSGGSRDLTQSRAGLIALGIMKKNLQSDLKERITDLKSATSKQEVPDIGELRTLAGEVFAIGTDDQKQDVADMLEIATTGQKLAQLPQAEREAAVAHWQNELKDGASEFERKLAGIMTAANQRVTEHYKKDPYAAHSRYAQGAPPPVVVNFSNPQQAEAALAQRVAVQKTIQADQQMQPFSVLRPGEAQATAQLLTQGNSALATNALTTIAKLPPAMAAETLADPVIRDAVISMSRSSDPARMNPAMSVLDQQWQRDQAAYNKNFPGTINSLQTWQTFKDSSSPEELTKNMRFASDPSQNAARNAQEKEATAELSKIKPGDVVSAFRQSWVPFTGPSAPIDTPGVSNVVPTAADVDPLQSGRLTAEFESHYTELRKSGVPADQATNKAVERLKINWKQSETNNGAMTRHAPELHYPAVNGSHSYIREQIETQIDVLYGRGKQQPLSAVGVSAGAFTPTVPGVGAREYSFVATVADKQTEAEVSAKQPPKYQIVVKNDRTGRLELMFNPETGNTRWGFDPQPARDAAEKRAYEQPRADLERRQQALEKSGLGGAFKEAQQRRIDEQRAVLDRQRPVNPNQPQVAGTQSVDESGF